MSMPWDRFQPEPEPEPEPEPTPNLPKRYEGHTVTPEAQAMLDALRDGLSQAFKDLAKDAKEEATDYVRDTLGATVSGKTVDHQNPTITATTSSGRELVVADAKSRSWRTFVQGLAIDLVAALVAVLAMLADLDPFAKETWILLGALFVKTLIQTVAAYVMRLRVTPTIHTPGQEMALMPVPRPLLPGE
jgi:flagellar motor component MotA